PDPPSGGCARDAHRSARRGSAPEDEPPAAARHRSRARARRGAGVPAVDQHLLGALSAHQWLVLLRFEQGLSLRELGALLDIGHLRTRRVLLRTRPDLHPPPSVGAAGDRCLAGHGAAAVLGVLGSGLAYVLTHS